MSGRFQLDIRPLGRDFDLHDCVTARIDGRIVHIDDVLALLAVALIDRFLHLLDGLLERNHVRDFEECRLHDRIGARTESQLRRDLRSVDDIEIDLVLGQENLHVIGQRPAGRFGIVHRVQEERTARLEALQHVVLIHVRRHVARHEIGRGHQVRRGDRLVAEAQVRSRVAARLLRVVCEIGLAIFVGRTADDLDRVLVGAHRTVCPQSEEEGLERAGLRQRNLLAYGQRTECHIVHDAHRELILGFVRLQIGENRQHLRRSGVFRRKTVTATDDERLALAGNLLAVGKSLHDIHIERIAIGSRLLRAVEHADTLHRFGQHGGQVFYGEGTEQMYGHHARLLAFGIQVIDRLLQRFGHRTHGDHHAVGIRSAVVGKRFIGAARDLGYFLHRLGYHVGNRIVELVRRLAGLEIDVGVLGRAARNGMRRVERSGTERLQRVAVEHRGQRRFVDQLDLLDLVRSTESVEEMEERNACLERHDMRDTCQVHHLLHGRSGEHREAGLTRGHHVLMVAEDRKRLGRQRTRRYVEYAGQQLAGDLVHIGNHQQQALRCRKSRSQRTALQRSVHGTGGTGLRLHLDYPDCFSENIFTTLSGPLIDKFRHRRGRSDGVNRRNLREHISYVGCRVITVACDKFLFCHFYRY